MGFIAVVIGLGYDFRTYPGLSRVSNYDAAEPHCRKLNEYTTRDSFPLPNMEDNLSRLSHSTIFSALDASGAYHVVPIAKEDRCKTAFATPLGIFEYKYMPFGLSNAPATYRDEI